MASTEVITDLPGVFYRRPSPDAAPFVEPGQQVAEGAVLGLIEIMKQFSELTAPVAGVLTEFTIEENTAVDAGAVVAKIVTD